MPVSGTAKCCACTFHLDNEDIMEKCGLCGVPVGKYPVYVKHDGKEFPCCCGMHADQLWGKICLLDFAKAGAPNNAQRVLHLFKPPN